MGAGKKLWGWYPTTNVWVPLQVDENGKVVVDMSAVNINDLGDINITSIADLDLLIYDAATSKWVNITSVNLAAALAALTNIDDLADVLATSPPNEAILVFYAATSKWGTSPFSTIELADLGTKELNDLDDLNVPTPTDGHVLYWDNATSKWKDKALTAATAGADVTIFTGKNYHAIGAGTWNPHVNPAHPFCYGHYNTAGNDLDEIDYRIWLGVGTYTLVRVGETDNNQGILDIDIDAVEVASFDLYSASSVKDAVQRQTGIVVATAGLKVITFRVDGKHASSSKYHVFLGHIEFRRTA